MSAQIFYNNGSSSSEIITHLVNASDGAGLHFNGTSGNIDIASPPDLGTKFSFEFIVQADSITNSYLVDFGNGGRFALAITSGVLTIYDDATRTFSNGTFLNDLKVHHLTLTVDGTSAKLYDNANLVDSLTVATSDIDSCADARIGTRNNAAAGTFFNGTIYRARFWNKTLSSADVTSVYESASIDYADQWGSQTSLVDAAASVFTSGTYSWVADVSNTIANVSNTLAITYVNNASGAYNYLRNAADLTTDLTVGKKYRLTVDAKYAGGSSGSRLKLNDGANNFYSANLTTSLVNYTFEFTARTTAVAPYIQLDAMTASNVVTIDNWYVREIGCAFDLDLAYANPTQSTIVQNRSGSGDATAVGGVTQISPIEAVNTNKLNVGGTTPLVGIGLAAGSTPSEPLEVVDTVKIQNAGTSNLIIDNTFSGGGESGQEWLLMNANSGSDSTLQFKAGISGGAASSGKLVMLMSATGNVGLGVVPVGKLQVKAASNVNLSVSENSGAIRLNGVNDAADANVPMEFTASSYNLIGGNVGVGVAPDAPLHIFKDLHNAAIATPDESSSYQLHINGPAGSTNDTVGISMSCSPGLDTISASMVAVDTGSAGIADLTFSTRGSGGIAERLRISSEGNVGVGVTTPSANLHVRDGAAGQNSTFRLTRQHTDDYGVELTAVHSSGSVHIDSLGDNAGPEMLFRMRTLGTPITALKIDGTGLASFSAGIAFSGQTDASGTGITSGATTLNHYETGLWSPTIFGGTTAGTYTLEAARTGGTYTRVGNLVTVYGVLRITSIDSAGAGNLHFGGLPFNFGPNIAPSWGQGGGLHVESYGAGTIASASTYPPPWGGVADGAGTATFSVTSYGKNYQVATVIGDVSAGSWIYIISGTYLTA